MNLGDPSVYTPVYSADEIGAPMTLPETLRPPRSILQTQTAKVLMAWRENFGLSMTAHLLCHVMQRPWADIREELATEFPDGFFRTISCPNINDIAYYLDHPYHIAGDPSNKVLRYPQNLEYSDKKIAAYPPENGFINSWNGEGRKEYKFMDKARHWKNRSAEAKFTDEQIVEVLRAACHVK